MKPYPKYKDSGIEWLGKVPEGWEVKKLKYLLRKKITDGPHETPVFIDDGIPFLSVDSIQDGKLIFENCRYISKDNHLKYQKKCKPQRNDVLMGKAASIGKIAIVDVDFEFSIWSPLALLKTNDKIIEGNFLEFALKSDCLQDQINIFSTLNTQQNISMDEIGNFSLYVPPIKEQQLIANFLDQKTTKIDELVMKNERLTELLKEERQAIISQAVTKGIPPHSTLEKSPFNPPLAKGGWGDLKMKDSGIEWIKEIPESWTLIPMKYATYMKGRIGWQGLKQSEFTDEGPYLITGMNFKDGVIRWEEVYHITEERYNEAPEIHLKIGDVLMTKDGTIGKLLFVDDLPGKASLNSHLLVLRPLKDFFLPKYLYYLLNSEYFKNHIEIYKTGTTFFGITQEVVGFFKILLPSIEEQQAIIEFIDLENTKIDLAISNILKQIDFLKEYRQALISNVVTGKVRVDK